MKGQDIAAIPHKELNEIRKKLGMSFQGGALFGSMTVGENVALPLHEHSNLEDSTIDIVVRLKLNQVGLLGFEDYMPSELSGGMLKRAAVARAMAMDPEILFFDEPSAGSGSDHRRRNRSLDFASEEGVQDDDHRRHARTGQRIPDCRSNAARR